MKKFALLLFFTLLLSVSTISFAETTPTEYISGSFTYILLEDGTAKITNYSGSDKILDIPYELDGNTITAIGDSAFYYRKSLSSVSIPDTIVSLGNNPFTYCAQLTRIYVSPDHPTLATIDGALYDKTEKRLVTCYNLQTEQTYSVPQGVLIIGDNAFAFHQSLTSVSIPDSVITIGNSAFANCYALESVTFAPNSRVTTIGKEAFASCTHLTSITIPENVVSIADGAFAFCEPLRELSIPNSVTYMGENVFNGCKYLTLSVNRGSFTADYAKENKIPHAYPDSLDWLN